MLARVGQNLALMDVVGWLKPARAPFAPALTALRSWHSPGAFLVNLTFDAAYLPSPSPSSSLLSTTVPSMADAASGSADKSVQVKLVLLGKSLFPFLSSTGQEPPLLSYPSLPRLLTGTIATQAKLPWANLLSSFASYVVSPSVSLTFPNQLRLHQVSNEFQANKEPTIGAAFLTQKCRLEDRVLRYEIWDTAGQERFHSLAVSMTTHPILYLSLYFRPNSKKR